MIDVLANHFESIELLIAILLALSVDVLYYYVLLSYLYLTGDIAEEVWSQEDAGGRPDISDEALYYVYKYFYLLATLMLIISYFVSPFSIYFSATNDKITLPIRKMRRLKQKGKTTLAERMLMLQMIINGHTSSVNAIVVSSSLTAAYQSEWGTAKTSASSHRHGHDHSSERTTGSRNSVTEERGRDQMIGFIESLNEEMTESKTVTDVIKFRAEAVKDENGSYVWTPPASQRHRRYLHKHLHCQEGAIRPVSRLCNQYEECHHNKWRIRSSKPAGAAIDDAEGC
ncbi:unnamed protein product, partial [Mesorhabditis belari]|uniref:Uncharacterized protein n=1 Tax=Mesorhabditis belari TaxID=2138241 RepID=A0AAF3J3J2_9BILA